MLKSEYLRKDSHSIMFYVFNVSVPAQMLSVDATVTKLTAFSGGSIIIKCAYENKYQANQKCFCKGDEKTCRFNTLSQTTEKRFMILDTKQNHFLVLMRNLIPKDSGTYQCLVEQSFNAHKIRTFSLKVKEGKVDLIHLQGNVYCVHCIYRTLI